MDLRRLPLAILLAVVSFIVFGSVAALWENPLFVRMTPVGGFEVALLAALSVLLGVYVLVKRPACSVKTAGAGTVISFLGIACPVCNKILLLIFGGELLLTYYEPLRVYVAAAGAIIMGLAVLHEWREGEKLRRDAALQGRLTDDAEPAASPASAP
jgi:hypothetical protein